MKPIREFRGRANTSRRPDFYRLHLEVMEERLPPGDAFTGALVGSWWLGALPFLHPAQRAPEGTASRSASSGDVSQILLADGSSGPSWRELLPTPPPQYGSDSTTQSADRQRDAREPLRAADSLALDASNQRPTTAGHAVQLREAVSHVTAPADGLTSSGTAGLVNRPALTTSAGMVLGPVAAPGSGLLANVLNQPTASPVTPPPAAQPAAAVQPKGNAVAPAPMAEQAGPPASALSPSLSVASKGPLPMNTGQPALVSAASLAPPNSGTAPPGPLDHDGSDDNMLLGGFDGLNAVNNACACSPPDTIGAAGPNSFIESVNTAMGLYNKTTGAQISRVELGSFFNTGLGGVLSLSDPVVIYDEQVNQFVLGILDFSFGGQSRLDVAISNTSDPTLSASDWTFRRYNVNDGVGGFDFADYPKIGYNADGYVFSFNMFPGGSFYDHVATLSVRKNDLTGFLNVVSGGTDHHTFAPARMHDAAPGSPMWFVEAVGSGHNGDPGDPGNQIRTVRMDNPFSASPTFVYTALNVNAFLSGISPLGGRTGLGTRMYHSALRTVGGVTHLVAAHSPGFNDGSGTHSKVQWYDIDVSDPSAPHLIQQGRIDPGPGIDTYFPDADIGLDGAIGMNYSQSVPFGSNLPRPGLMDMYVTGRVPSDPLGTLETPMVAKLGAAQLNAFGRAGDYSFTTIDPVDGTFWAANEYSANIASPNWATWISHFRLELPAGPSVITTTPGGNTFGNMSSVRVGFDEEINPDTFTPDKVLFLSPGSIPITVTNVEPVDGSGDRQFQISFANQTTLGNYIMVIGPDIEDINGNPMDQNHNGIPGEIPGDQYVARITLQGPKITASTPAFGAVLTPQNVSSVRVTFNEPMDPATFTPAKIASFVGPRGNITVTTVTPVAGSNNMQFDIGFAPQAFTGYYTMVIGPNIQDMTGHPMDQNGNFIPGEVPGDQYIERFGIQGPRVTTSNASTSLPNQTRSVRVTFSEAMNPTTFTPSAVQLVGPDGPVAITGVTPVVGSNNTQFDIAFAPLTVTGPYHLTVGPHIRDTFGNEMDQNQNLIPGEDPSDQFTATLGVQGPRIISQSLSGGLAPQSVSTLRVTFNEAIDPTTFTPDKIVSFTRTNGTVVTDLASTITTVTHTDNLNFTINFQSTGATGRYVLLIGPDISDTFGNAMDQNQNLIPGEVPGDEYTATFTLLGPRITGQSPSGSLVPPTPNGETSLQVTFNEAMNPASFTPDQVVSFTRTNGTAVTDLLSTITTITPVAGNRSFNINFRSTGITGLYTLVIGPHIRDTFGNEMDQNNNLILGEVPGDQYTATFTLLGPRVTASSPSGLLTPQLVNSVQVTFNESMNPTTFTPDQVVSFTRTNGTVVTDLLATITTVVPVAGSNNTRFNINFQSTGLTGQYTLVIGPHIQDTFGNEMDQNGNLIPGEDPGDQYAATFAIQGPRINSSTPSGSNVPQLVSSVQVTFNEAMDPASFTPDQVVSFTRTNGTTVTDLLATITTVVPVAGSNNTRFNINFQSTGTTGQYALTVGPHIRDLFGNEMDQNGNLIPGEDPGDQYTATFTLQGPRITSSVPNTNVLGQVNSVRVTFNEAMDPATFTPDKIASFTGPNGPIDVTGIFIAGGNTQFDITFASQDKTGHYTMVIGPDVEDYFGNEMDQNQNLIPGEDPGDQYTATFGIQGPRVTSSSVTGGLPGQIQSLRVVFNESMDPATFTPDKIASFKGPGGVDLPVTDVQPVPLTANTQFDIFFDPLTVAGNYTMVIGPDIRDPYGNEMDQNQNLIPGEIPGDQYTTTFTVAGPVIVASNPANNNASFGPIDHVQVTFNEPIDASTFTPDQVTSFTGPGGDPILVTDVQEVPATNHTQFNILFDPQEDVGRYMMVVGSGIEDLYGNPTRQPFPLTFNLISSTIGPDGFGYTGSTYPFEPLDIQGQPDTFTIIQYADDASAAVNLGSNTFNFYGHVYTGNNQLFASSNGLITFGSANSEYVNTNLTNDPAQAAIAPLWTDWIKTSGSPMLVGQFQDLDGDGVPDRLVLQWTQLNYISGSQPVTFQVFLSLNTGAQPSSFVFNYVDLGDLDTRNLVHTVGIKDTSTQGANRLLAVFNQTSPFVKGGQAMLFQVASGDASRGEIAAARRGTLAAALLTNGPATATMPPTGPAVSATGDSTPPGMADREQFHVVTADRFFASWRPDGTDLEPTRFGFRTPALDLGDEDAPAILSV